MKILICDWHHYRQGRYGRHGSQYGLRAGRPAAPGAAAPASGGENRFTPATAAASRSSQDLYRAAAS
jgi:hypothetical protein